MAAAAGTAGVGLATDPAHTRWIRRPDAATASRAHHQHAWPSLASPRAAWRVCAIDGQGDGDEATPRQRGDAAVGG
jgi:hypothetical protein